ncbi:unnamed protein product [Paramecium pentaurelia]|uniref:Uncharacterized protein n=1 Tax=Paramecium pentaurelia TaxID=43138 RepID=A0A8S1SDF2_9CILI|nr:unnamed protein product [Paramecium pentaurelia]
MENLHPAQEIIFNIVSEIQKHHDFINYMNSNSQKIKQGLWIQQYFKNEPNIPIIQNIIRVVELQNEYIPIKQHFHHILVHKQNVPNLCGYHATYNLIQCVQSIKYKIPPLFYNIAAFWTYVKRTQDFLRQYRNKYQLDSTIWPWRDSDIEKGDFERTYLKSCLHAKPLFKTTFQNEIIQDIKYLVTNDTIFFQYGNVINGYNERVALQKKFDQFKEFKPQNNEELIQTYMLGVTNHWICFVAYKCIQGTQFIVMDSRNRDFFLWNQQQIRDFLQQDQLERPKRGQNPLNQFYLDLYEQGMKDLQQIITLLISWITGQTKLESYVSNQKIRVFLNPLIELLEISQNEYLNLKFNNQNEANLYQIMALWADQYIITVSEFIGNATNITQINKALFLKSIELAQSALEYQTKNGLWNQQKQSPLHSILKCLKIINQSI